MIIINATSKSIFTVSKKSSPSKKCHNKAIVIAEKVNVREWAGAEKKLCDFGPLHTGDLVNVCDAILSARGNVWYYIKYKDKYGFIHDKYVNDLDSKINKFITCLEDIHSFVKQHPKSFKYSYDGSLTTFADVKARVAKKIKVGFTCLVPMRLAFKAAGIKREDGKSLLIGYKGSFKQTFTGSFKKYMKRITEGSAIGLTVKQAVDKKLLKIGDTLCFKNVTHTFTYTGKDYIMYDGGHSSMKDGTYTGIKANYKNDKRKISEIIRWKNI